MVSRLCIHSRPLAWLLAPCCLVVDALQRRSGSAPLLFWREPAARKSLAAGGRCSALPSLIRRDRPALGRCASIRSVIDSRHVLVVNAPPPAAALCPERPTGGFASSITGLCCAGEPAQGRGLARLVSEILVVGCHFNAAAQPANQKAINQSNCLTNLSALSVSSQNRVGRADSGPQDSRASTRYCTLCTRHRRAVRAAVSAIWAIANPVAE